MVLHKTIALGRDGDHVGPEGLVLDVKASESSSRATNGLGELKCPGGSTSKQEGVGVAGVSERDGVEESKVLQDLAIETFDKGPDWNWRNCRPRMAT